MITKYYECHITMLGNPTIIKSEMQSTKWKFSSIDGDPSLGDGVKCYATRHFNYKVPEDEVLRQLINAANFLRFLDINVIREKIELVIHDTKSSSVRID